MCDYMDPDYREDLNNRAGAALAAVDFITAQYEDTLECDNFEHSHDAIYGLLVEDMHFPPLAVAMIIDLIAIGRESSARLVELHDASCARGSDTNDAPPTWDHPGPVVGVSPETEEPKSGD